jgi:hypothetical protein
MDMQGDVQLVYATDQQQLTGAFTQLPSTTQQSNAYSHGPAKHSCDVLRYLLLGALLVYMSSVLL